MDSDFAGCALYVLVSGMTGDIRYCITNNGGYISNLKLLAIADFSFPNRRENDVRVISFHPVYDSALPI